MFWSLKKIYIRADNGCDYQKVKLEMQNMLRDS
jgi:hypothetical protein